MLTIGSDWASNVSSDLFNGRIDEVALYNRALSDVEIASIFDADVVGKNFSQPYFTSPAHLPDRVLGASHTQPVTTILGALPISFSLSGGALPPGMTLSSAGLVSGFLARREFITLPFGPRMLGGRSPSRPASCGSLSLKLQKQLRHKRFRPLELLKRRLSFSQSNRVHSLRPRSSPNHWLIVGKPSA